MFKQIHVFRVKPGQELISEISSYCRNHNISSGLIVGIIGSATRDRINYLMSLPGKYDSVELNGPLEIVCAQGSIASKDDNIVIHIHAQLGEQGSCYGGHLAEAVIFSTAEVSIGELDVPLKRQTDSYTGLNELLN